MAWDIEQPNGSKSGISAVCAEGFRKPRQEAGKIVKTYMKITDDQQRQADAEKQRHGAESVFPGVNKIAEQQTEIQKGSHQQKAAFFGENRSCQNERQSE